MDWEKKFSSIIGETEANLDRVKEKLSHRHIIGSGNRTFDDTYHSRRGMALEDRLSVSMQYPPSSTPKTVNWQSVDNSYSRFNNDHGSFSSKLEQQNRMIDHLSNLVKVMERERDEHKQQINDLKYEIRELSKHVTDKEKEESLQRQIAVLKNDISKEVESIRNQVHIYKTRHDTSKSNHYDNQDYTRSKDISDLRKIMRDEMEYMKTDLECFRHRLDVVEKQIQMTNGGHESTRLNRMIDNISDNRRLLHEARESIPSTYNPSVHHNKTIDSFEISNLRLNVSALKDKLDKVEDKLQHNLIQSNHPPFASNVPLTGSSSIYKTKYGDKSKSHRYIDDIVDIDDDINDLELSDDKFEDSDDLDSDLDLEEDGAPDLASTRKKEYGQKTIDELDLELMKLEKKEALLDSDISDGDIDRDLLDL